MKLKSFFDESEDVLLLNTQYVPPMKNELTNKWTEGYLYLVYRDNVTKEKHIRVVKNPQTDTFITKPEYRNSFKTQRAFIDANEVDRYSVQYNKIPWFIKKQVEEDGKDTEYLKIFEESPKELYKWRHSYFADYHICDYATIAYNTTNTITNTNITTAYLDIEGDVFGLSSTELDNASYPINAVSVVMPFNELGKRFKHPKVFTFLLRNHNRYKQQKYFETHLEKFLEECHEEFDEKYDAPQFIIRVFDDEITLLKSLFAVLHKLSPDFIEIWN